MRHLSETYFREEPRDDTPKTDWLMQMESLAHDKKKKAEVIRAWTRQKDHPKAEDDFKSEVGSAVDENDLDDDEMGAAFQVIGEGGMIYASFEHTLWTRHKGQLIRVM